MPSFSYKAVSAENRNTKGVIEAESKTHAAKVLREKKLFPLEIKELDEHSKKKLLLPQKRISAPRLF